MIGDILKDKISKPSKFGFKAQEDPLTQRSQRDNNGNGVQISGSHKSEGKVLSQSKIQATDFHPNNDTALEETKILQESTDEIAWNFDLDEETE